MSEYRVPEEFYFRIHHIRPRFKADVENVLIYLAEKLVSIGEKNNSEFKDDFNQAIKEYPGNATRKIKTINNWRTEICSLFGFVEDDGISSRPGLRAKELAEKQDLIEFFKIFLYNFQYPGAHLKPHEVLKMINAGINFKPAQYILKLLTHACEAEKTNVALTKYEVCHCVFNDLRCTRDNEDVSLTWKRIKDNRKKNLTYDQSGDVIRYAGDIIDYMVIANLLVTYDGRKFYINKLEEEAILKFINSKEWYSGYDQMIRDCSGSLEDIKSCEYEWFSYVNRDIGDTDFSTDILAFIAKNNDELQNLQNSIETINSLSKIQEAQEEEFKAEDATTKEIGDKGESLIYGHECMRIKLGDREDLIHLIKRIPTAFAIGYDISSIELDEKKRFIEVKTTISSSPLHFNKFHLTKNEWHTAESVKDRYFVYRLMISKFETKLFLLQDPVGLYKTDQISIVLNDGADIIFNPNNVGEFKELLMWKN